MTMSNRLPTRDIPHGEIGVGSKLIPLFKAIIATLPILLMAFTSACAGFDASVLDSAECLGKGNISTGVVYAMGVQAPEWIEIDPENIFDSDSAALLQALDVRYGLQDDIDASVRLTAHDSGWSGKVLLKKQLNKTNKATTAVVIGGGYLWANGGYWRESEIDWDRIDSKLLSGEIQFLITRQLSRSSFATIAARGNFHQFDYEYMNQTESQDFYHAGLRLNLGRNYGGFLMMIELGLEAPLSAGEITSVYPWAGYKMAWNWNTKKK